MRHVDGRVEAHDVVEQRARPGERRALGNTDDLVEADSVDAVRPGLVDRDRAVRVQDVGEVDAGLEADADLTQGRDDVDRPVQETTDRLADLEVRLVRLFSVNVNTLAEINERRTALDSLNEQLRTVREEFKNLA